MSWGRGDPEQEGERCANTGELKKKGRKADRKRDRGEREGKKRKKEGKEEGVKKGREERREYSKVGKTLEISYIKLLINTLLVSFVILKQHVFYLLKQNLFSISCCSVFDILSKEKR